MSCASNKEPAAAAIKAAEMPSTPSKAEAVKYVPDKAKAVEDAITAAKGIFRQERLRRGSQCGKGYPEKVKELSAAARGKEGGADQILGGDERRIAQDARRRKEPAGYTLEEQETAPQAWTRRSLKAPSRLRSSRHRCGTMPRPPSRGQHR